MDLRSGAGEEVMMSRSEASCWQNVSRGRSLTSLPKGFSISAQMDAMPWMI